jgi:hypothetical protein
VLVASAATELGRFLAERFEEAGGDVLDVPPARHALRRLDVLVVPMGPFGVQRDADVDREQALRGPFSLVEHLQALGARLDRFPRYAIGFCEREAEPEGDGESIALALARTLCRYVSAHTVCDDLRVNLVSAPLSRGRAVWKSAADVGLALASGLLDAMRGQVLDVTDHES